MKIDKFIVSQSQYSRRKILGLIKQESIKCNGNIVTSLTQEINPSKDIITINGKALDQKQIMYYYKFNKPKNVISTLSDPKNRRCLKDYLDRQLKLSSKKFPSNLFPVGRLDRHSKGLLLFTNNGDLANKLMHPNFKLAKLYKVTLDIPITANHLRRLTAGIILEDGPVQFSKVELNTKVNLIVTLKEGRNRIIRRTFEHLGYEVKTLFRMSIGSINLGKLQEGEFNEFSQREKNYIEKL